MTRLSIAPFYPVIGHVDTERAVGKVGTVVSSRAMKYGHPEPGLPATG